MFLLFLPPFLFIFERYFYMYLVSVYVCTCQPQCPCGVRGLVGVTSLFPPCVFWRLNQVLSLDGKSFYSLTHLAGPEVFGSITLCQIANYQHGLSCWCWSWSSNLVLCVRILHYDIILFSIFYPIYFGREVIVTMLMYGECHTILRTKELPKLFGTLL